MITSQLPDTIKQHKESNPDHLRFGVALVSTTRYNELANGLPSTDKTLAMVEPLLQARGHVLARREIVADDEAMIQAIVTAFTGAPGVDVLVTCGGTGISPRDVTIDAIAAMKPKMPKLLPGFGELFRALSFQDVGGAAMLSRSEAFVIDQKPVFCLPGSPKAVQLGLERLILPEIAHLLAMLRKKE
ncbi:MAG: MogA/MoaB family molybdenum cofactor biosynthesis protein [Candidatus Lokiarchaeota archaeon]|nr:MogA/MoaB family molybdenum cofactor biosynthesis protein [Candidatus Lokiarchaeota archaeon]